MGARAGLPPCYLSLVSLARLSGAARKAAPTLNANFQRLARSQTPPSDPSRRTARLATTASITAASPPPPPSVNGADNSKVAGVLPGNAAAEVRSRRVCSFKVCCCAGRRQVRLLYSGLQTGKQNKAQLPHCGVHAGDRAPSTRLWRHLQAHPGTAASVAPVPL